MSQNYLRHFVDEEVGGSYHHTLYPEIWKPPVCGQGVQSIRDTFPPAHVCRTADTRDEHVDDKVKRWFCDRSSPSYVYFLCLQLCRDEPNLQALKATHGVYFVLRYYANSVLIGVRFRTF